jgi:hypothetical protein
MPRFAKGNRFSTGRQLGSRNKSTRELDEVAAHGAGKVIAIVRELAEDGDMRAAAMLLARVWPRRRGRPLTLDLPAIEKPADLIQAQAALIAAMARGEVTPEEATSIGKALESQRRALETYDHELRIQELEAKRKSEPGTNLWQEPE